jgi:hypothetical protein
LAALKVTATVIDQHERFHRPVRAKEVVHVVLRVVFLVVLPTILEVPNYVRLLYKKELYSILLLLVDNSLV